MSAQVAPPRRLSTEEALAEIGEGASAPRRLSTDEALAAIGEAPATAPSVPPEPIGPDLYSPPGTRKFFKDPTPPTREKPFLEPETIEAIGAPAKVAGQMAEGFLAPWREYGQRGERAQAQRAVFDRIDAENEALRAAGKPVPRQMVPREEEPGPGIFPSLVGNPDAGVLLRSLMGAVAAPFAGFETAAAERDRTRDPSAAQRVLAAPGDFLRTGVPIRQAVFGKRPEEMTPEERAAETAALARTGDTMSPVTGRKPGELPEGLRAPAEMTVESIPAGVAMGLPGAVRSLTPAARNAALDARLAPAPRPTPTAQTMVAGPEPTLPPGASGVERLPAPVEVTPRIAPSPRGVALNKALSEGNVTKGEITPKIDVTSPPQRIIGRVAAERTKPPATVTAQAARSGPPIPAQEFPRGPSPPPSPLPRAQEPAPSPAREAPPAAVEGAPARAVAEPARTPLGKPGEAVEAPARLWRQASPSEADAMLNPGTMEGSPYGIPERFVATDRSLALGQGGNRSGVILEFDPQGLDVASPRSAKPGSAFVEGQGGGGERVLRGKSADVGKNIRSVTIPPGKGDVYSRRLALTLEHQGWVRETTPEGTVYRRPEPPPAPSPASAPEAPPPAAAETVRLYRVEPTKRGNAPEWVRKAKEASGETQAEGAWYSSDPSDVAWYQSDAAPTPTRVITKDVPAASVEQYRVSNLPPDHPARKFSRRPDTEFFLPDEMRDRPLKSVEQPPPAAGSSPAKGGGTGVSIIKRATEPVPEIVAERQTLRGAVWQGGGESQTVAVDAKSAAIRSALERALNAEADAKGMKRPGGKFRAAMQGDALSGKLFFDDLRRGAVYGSNVRSIMRQVKEAVPDMTLDDLHRALTGESLPSGGGTGGLKGAKPRGDVTLGSGLGGIEGMLPGKKPPEPFSADPATQAAYERLSARINTEPESAPLRERAKNFGLSVYDRMVRQEGPLARFEKAASGKVSEIGPAAVAKEAQGSSARKALGLETAGVLENVEVPTPLAEALKEVPVRDQRQLAAYTVAKRFSTKYDPKGLKTGITPEDAAAIVKAVESDPTKAHVVKAAQAYHNFHDALLKSLAEADRWAPDRYQKTRAENPFYAHILREMEEGGTGAPKRTGPFRTPGLKPVTGGEQPIRDPFLTFREDAQRMISMADKARVKHRILDTLEERGGSVPGWLEEVPREVAKREVPDYDAILAAHDALAKGEASPAAVARMTREFTTQGRGEIVPAVRNGQVKFYKIEDPLLSEYLRSEVSQSDIVHRAYEAVTKHFAEPVTRTQRLLTTGVNIAFWPANALRDMKTYFHLTEQKNPVMATANLVRGYYHAMRGTAAEALPGIAHDTGWSKTFKRLGVEGLIGSDQAATRGALTRYGKRGVVENVREYVKAPWVIMGDGVGSVVRMGKSAITREFGEAATQGIKAAASPLRAAKSIAEPPLGSIVRGLRNVSSAVEGGPRYAEMLNASKRLGVKPDQSMTTFQRIALSNRASEITNNFRLGGKAAKQWNRWEAFVNARIQGFENVRQNWKSNPKKMATRALLYSVVPEVALWAYIHADDERRKAYDALPDWRKATMTNLPYKGDDGKWHFFSLPMVAELDLPGRAVRAALDYGYKDDPKAFAEQAKQIAGDLSPVSGDDWLDVAMPSAAQGAMDVLRDKSGFTGRSINPQGFEGVETYRPEIVKKQGSSSTAEWISKKLHEATDFQPLKNLGVTSKLTTADIDHLLRSYGGPVTRDAVRLQSSMPKELADTPVIGRFAPRESESSHVDRFYDLAKTVEAKRTTFRRLAEGEAPDVDAYATSSKIVGFAGKVKTALQSMRDKYAKATNEAERRTIADEMDALASEANQVLSGFVEEQRK